MSETALALSVYDKITDPMAAVEKMGTFLAKSGMFGCEKVEQGQVLALACMCERKNPIEIARTYHIIEGRLSMKADAMLAAFRSRGGKVKWKQFDTVAAIADWTYDGQTIEISFTIEDACRAGFVDSNGKATKPKSNWDKWPDAMLRARCVSKALRMICPEVNAGVYTEEEIADFSNDAPAGTPALKTVVPKASKTVTVEAKIEQTPAPVDPPKIEEKPAETTTVTPPPVQQTPQADPSKLSLATKRETVVQIAGEHLEKAVAWLRKNEWLSADQDVNSLGEEFCDRILPVPDKWLTKFVLADKPAPKVKK